jgi:arylsulfatase A
MRSSEITIAEVLKDAGYKTGIFGKWHNGEQYPNHPNGQGFDEFLGFCSGHWNNYFNSTIEHNGKEIKTEGYITDVLTDAAIRFIRENKEVPFFCYVPYNAPHSPNQVPDKYFDKYHAKGLDDETACIYGMCENVDENVGRILKTIDELQLDENTIILYLTDNGPNSVRWNGGMKGIKGHIDEGGLRVPLYMTWKGHLPEGITVESLAAHIDILPTLCELCKISLPQVKLDGHSLVPEIFGKRANNERLIFSHTGSMKVEKYNGTVRSDRFRFTYKKDGSRLYDMVADPCQLKDVSGIYPEIFAEMRTAYEDWWSEMATNGFDPPRIPVGYSNFSTTRLPAPDAKLNGGLSYFGKMGWANDWISDWTSTGCFASWPLSIADKGTYNIKVRYCCPENQVGSVLTIMIGKKQLEAKIFKAHDPEYIPSPDRIKRKEVYEKIWAELEFGSVTLNSGDYDLILQAKKIAKDEIGEIKSVYVTKVD